MKDVKPCPNCELDNNLAITYKDMYQVVCKWCGMRGPEGASENEAKDEWNSIPRRE